MSVDFQKAPAVAEAASIETGAPGTKKERHGKAYKNTRVETVSRRELNGFERSGAFAGLRDGGGRLRISAGGEFNSGGRVQSEAGAAQAEKPAQPPRRATNSTADHSKFEALKGPFANGSEVTKACLTCHNEAGHQFIKSIHWTWEYKNTRDGAAPRQGEYNKQFLHQCARQRGHVRECAMPATIWTRPRKIDFQNQNNIRLPCLP